jgi:hypothetical protein
MAISLQILDVDTDSVRFSKTFDIERTKQYPKATFAGTIRPYTNQPST